MSLRYLAAFAACLMIAVPFGTAQDVPEANETPASDAERQFAEALAALLSGGAIGEPCTTTVGCYKLPVYVDEDGDEMTGDLDMLVGKRIKFMPNNQDSGHQMSYIGLNETLLQMPTQLTNVVTISNNLTIMDGADLYFEGGTDLLSSGGSPQIGTTDNNAVQLIVNNVPLLRLQPAAGTGNVVGGHTSNAAVGTTTGSFIAGGGFWNNQASPNSIVDAENSFIGAGVKHDVETSYSSVVGGFNNDIRGDSTSSAILGGNSNTVDGHFASGIVAGQNNLISSGWMNVIGGGDQNEISSFYSFLGAGSRNYVEGSDIGLVGGVDNVATGTEVFLGGGRNNDVGAWGSTIAGGACNTVVADNGFIGGGGGHRGDTCATSPGHLVQDKWGTVGGGQNNQAGLDDFGDEVNQPAATVAGGSGNRATGAYSAIAGGKDAEASNYGSFAHASGKFGWVGDAQMVRMVARGVTTDSTPTDLFLDGTSELLLIPYQTTWSYEGRVVAMSDIGETKEWRLQGLIKNVGGFASVPGSGTTTLVGDGSSAWYGDAGETWNLTLSADDTNDALKLTVVGDSTDPVRFVANIEVTAVSFP